MSRKDTPVEDVQTMLRLLSHVHPGIPRLTPDGVFGERTLEGVMRFQQLADLPVTGTVDHPTWEALTAEHRRVSRQLDHPRTANLFPRHTATLQPGDTSPLLYPIQGMLLALSPVFGPVSGPLPTGILDEDTAHDLRWVQSLSHLPETGALDRDTWEQLARIYDTFVARQPGT